MSDKFEKLEKVVDALDKKVKVGIELHETPDPDALGAGDCIRRYLEKKDIESTILYTGTLSADMNKLMVKNFGIPIKCYDTNGISPEDFGKFIFVDHAGKRSKWYKGGLIKDENILAIIDHHNIGEDYPKAEYTDIRKIGSTSTIIAEYLNNGVQNLFSKEEFEEIATELFLGITTDTNNLREGVTPSDRKMHEFLSEHVDLEKIHMIENPEWSSVWMDKYGQAINTRETQNSITVASVGIIEPDDRDVIPMTANHLIKEKGTHTVYVMGIRQDIYDVSIRTKDLTFSYDKLREKFPEASIGGKDTSGGMQIKNQFTKDALIKFIQENYEKIETLVLDEFKSRIFSQK